MNFDFSDELKQLGEQARRFLTEHNALAAARRVLDGEDGHAAALWREIGKMGWIGAAIPEEYGGAGLGHVGLCVLAEEMGARLAPVPFSSSRLSRGRSDPARRQRRAEAALPAATRRGCRYRHASRWRKGRRAGAAKLDRAALPAAASPAPSGRCRMAHRRHRGGGGAGRRPAARPVPRRYRGAGVARERVATVDPNARPGAARLQRRRGGAARPRRRRRAAAERLLRPRRRALRVRAGRRRARGARHGQATTRWSAMPSAGRSARSRRSSTSSPMSMSRANWRAPTPITAPGRCTEDAPELPLAAATARVAASDAFSPRRQGKHPDPWRHGLYLGLRLPSLLSPRQAAGAGAGLRPHLEGPADRALEARNDGALEGAAGIGLKGGRPPWISTTPQKKPPSAPRREQFLAANAAAPRAGQRRGLPHRPERTRRARSAPRPGRRSKYAAGFAGITWPKEWGGRGGSADPAGDLQPGRGGLHRAARLVRDRPRHVHPDDDAAWGTAGTAPTLRAARARAARRSGASSSPSPPAAPTSRRCARAPSGRATTGSSTARRSGPRARITAITASWSRAAIPTCRSTRASPSSSST